MSGFDHEAYLSPFTWRYGSDAMRSLWSEREKRRTWRRIWVAMAEVQCEAGLVSKAAVDDLRAHQDHIDLARSHELEAELHHDLMAEVHAYAEQCPVGGGVIHLGATSMDVGDNTDALRIRRSVAHVAARAARVLDALCVQASRYADVPTMGFTHLQPAEPTTVGYRLAQYAQDLAEDVDDLIRVGGSVRGKGMKGAVGTSASFTQLLSDRDWTAERFERAVMERLGLEAFSVATQTAPRKQEYRVLCVLASVAQSAYKFAADLRILQSPPFGEWAEPFGRKQIGSSAMPFKRNPIHAENIDSLARLVAALPRVAWDNAAHSYLERTLDDSANRRVVLPQAFLTVDEVLRRMERLVSELCVDTDAAARNLDRYGVFAASERVMMDAAKRGGDRQVLHEVIRERSLEAWAAVRAGKPNPLADLLASDPMLTRWCEPAEIRRSLDARDYVGDAPRRARELAEALTGAVGRVAAVFGEVA